MVGLSATIITLASAGVVSAFAESICTKCGKEDYAQFIKLSAFGIAGASIITTTVAFFKALRQF